MTAPADTQPKPRTATSLRPGRNDLREVLTLALTHHREGRLGDAERIYRRVLAAEDEQPDALHLLGVIALDRGRPAEAVTLLSRAVAAAPDAAAIHNALGTALRATGDANAAIAGYRRAVELEPASAAFRTNLAAALVETGTLDEAMMQATQALESAPSYPDGHFVLGTLHRANGDNVAAESSFARAATSPTIAPLALLNLGNTRRDLGRLAEAADAYRTVLAVDPGHVAARFALGVTLQADGRIEEALSVLGALVEHVPEHREAWFHLGLLAHQLGATPVALDAYLCARRLGLDTVELHTNLGIALAQVGRLDEAVATQTRALAMSPDDAGLCLNLALTLRQAGRLEDAATICNRALTIDARCAAAYSLLGGIRVEQRQQDAALEAHRRARALEPQSPIVLNEFANALMDDDDIEGALSLYREALERAPKIPALHLHLALALLSAGRLPEGWREYEWRHALPNAQPLWKGPGQPWRGEPIDGRRVLVWREQGLGDEIMFASCLDTLVSKGAHVVLAATPRLRALYQRAFPDITVIDAADPKAHLDLAVDLHVPIGGLPQWVRSRVADFPARRPFLHAARARVAHWRERLRALGSGPFVGICWRSGLLTPSRRLGYAPLRDWAPVLQTDGVQFVNLQYDECTAELEAIKRVLGVTVHRWPDLDLRNNLDDAAALTTALDLAITAPTAVGELAGALGVSTWRIADQRDWTMLGTDRRPWFPSMDVCARSPRESWTELLARVATRLTDHFTSLPSTR
jgi:tetratricopeptide (TPR) repeat protein